MQYILEVWRQWDKLKRGFKSAFGIGTVTVMRQESPVAAPGPALRSLEMSTYSTHGNPAQTLWQKYNTLHYCTVSASKTAEDWAGGPNAARARSLSSLSFLPIVHKNEDLFDFFREPNKSVLSSSGNKAVYGMVEKSCHNHSGPLSYVALREKEMLPCKDNTAATLKFHPAPSLLE